MINLIPWREIERKYQAAILKKILFIGVGLLSLILVAIHIYLIMRQNTAHDRINFLKKEIERHQSLPLADFKQSQFRLNHLHDIQPLFATLSQSKQSALCFTGIQRNKKTVSFTGRGRSLVDLTDYLNQWSAGHLFYEVQIKSIEQQENGLIKFIFEAIER